MKLIVDSKALIKNCPNILRAFKEPSPKKGSIVVREKFAKTSVSLKIL